MKVQKPDFEDLLRLVAGEKPQDQILLIHLLWEAYARQRTNPFASRSVLLNATRMSRDGLRKAIERLEDVGYFKVTNRRSAAKENEEGKRMAFMFDMSESLVTLDEYRKEREGNEQAK